MPMLLSFYQNTYYNALDSVTVHWEIVESNVPLGWTYSNCFPNCFAPGVKNGTNSFLPNSQQYLNCHFYPNNIPGTGVVKMKITTNQSYVDTVTWVGVAYSASSVDEAYGSFSEPTMIFDLNGRRLNELSKNKVNILVYPNGRTEKLYVF